MEEHGIANDGKSQSGTAATVACAALVDSVEAFEDALKMLLPHSLSGIVIYEHNAVTVVAEEGTSLLFAADETGLHSTPGIADGIFQKIAEDGMEQRIVATQHQIGRKVEPHFYLGLRQSVAQVVDDLTDDVGKSEVLARKERRSGFGLGDDGNIAYQVGQTFRLQQRAPDEMCFAFFAETGILDKGLEIASDGRHRCSEFVGDVGGNLPFHLLCPCLLLIADKAYRMPHAATGIDEHE